MKMMRIVLTLVAILGVAETGVLAQSLPWEDKVFINIGGGVQTGGSDFTSRVSFQIYDETANFDEPHPVGAGGLFDVSGGVRLWRNFGVGVGYTRFSDSTGVTLSGSVPHPLFFNALRPASAQAVGLDRSESAVHFQAIWMIVVSDKIDIALSAGPSVYSVTQDIVNSVTIQEGPAPFDVVAGATTRRGEVGDRGLGYNVGADVTYRVTKRFGGGLFLRYAGASLTLPGPSGRAVHSSDAGGFQIGIGLRARF